MRISDAKKIPQILSAKALLIILPLLILVGGVATFALVYASEDPKIKDVVITNVTYNSATVTWETETPVKGRVVISKSSENKFPNLIEKVLNSYEKSYDDRNVEQVENNNTFEYSYSSEIAKDRTIHHVSIRNLEPSTEYSFQIDGNLKTFGGEDYKFTTLENPVSIQDPKTVYGDVQVVYVDEGGVPQQIVTEGIDGVVIYSVEGGFDTKVMSTIIGSDAKWTADISYPFAVYQENSNEDTIAEFSAVIKTQAGKAGISTYDFISPVGGVAEIEIVSVIVEQASQPAEDVSVAGATGRGTGSTCNTPNQRAECSAGLLCCDCISGGSRCSAPGGSCSTICTTKNIAPVEEVKCWIPTFENGSRSCVLASGDGCTNSIYRYDNKDSCDANHVRGTDRACTNDNQCSNNNCCEECQKCGPSSQVETCTNFCTPRTIIQCFKTEKVVGPPYDAFKCVETPERSSGNINECQVGAFKFFSDCDTSVKNVNAKNLADYNQKQGNTSGEVKNDNNFCFVIENNACVTKSKAECESGRFGETFSQNEYNSCVNKLASLWVSTGTDGEEEIDLDKSRSYCWKLIDGSCKEERCIRFNDNITQFGSKPSCEARLLKERVTCYKPVNSDICSPVKLKSCNEDANIFSEINSCLNYLGNLNVNNIDFVSDFCYSVDLTKAVGERFCTRDYVAKVDISSCSEASDSQAKFFNGDFEGRETCEDFINPTKFTIVNPQYLSGNALSIYNSNPNLFINECGNREDDETIIYTQDGVRIYCDYINGQTYLKSDCPTATDSLASIVPRCSSDITYQISYSDNIRQGTLSFNNNNINLTCTNSNQWVTPEPDRLQSLCAQETGSTVVPVSSITPDFVRENELDSDFSLFTSVSAQPLTPETITPDLLNRGVYKLDIEGYGSAEFTIYADGIKVQYFEDTNGDGTKQENEPFIDLTQYQIQISKQQELKSYAFNTGWNSVTFNIISQNLETASEVVTALSAQGIRVEQISRFDKGQWLHFVVEPTASGVNSTFGTDFKIIPGQGYFIRTLNQGTAYLTGNTFESSVPIPLESGWNLIGVQSPTNYTANQFLDVCNSQNASCVNISRYDQGVYDSVVIEDGVFFGNNFQIRDSEGYFLLNEGGGGVIRP